MVLQANISYNIGNLQICLFGLNRFSLVTFLENNQLALKHLFLKNYQTGQQGVVVYTRDQLYDYLHYAHEQVCFHICIRFDPSISYVIVHFTLLTFPKDLHIMQYVEMRI